ncbi:MAG: pilin, partial [Minisyncoccia bacterium]
MQKQLKNLAKFISLFSLLAFFPMMAFAAGTTSCSSATGLSAVICTIQSLFAAILPVLVAFGVLYFVWGMIMYFVVDSEEAKKTGRDRIINGVIGLAVILGIWGIVNLLMVTFNLSGSILAAPQGININGGTIAGT